MHYFQRNLGVLGLCDKVLAVGAEGATSVGWQQELSHLGRASSSWLQNAQLNKQNLSPFSQVFSMVCMPWSNLHTWIITFCISEEAVAYWNSDISGKFFSWLNPGKNQCGAKWKTSLWRFKLLSLENCRNSDISESSVDFQRRKQPEPSTVLPKNICTHM